MSREVAAGQGASPLCAFGTFTPEIFLEQERGGRGGIPPVILFALENTFRGAGVENPRSAVPAGHVGRPAVRHISATVLQAVVNLELRGSPPAPN